MSIEMIANRMPMRVFSPIVGTSQTQVVAPFRGFLLLACREKRSGNSVAPSVPVRVLEGVDFS
jgi:hypothetical protein